MAEKIINVKINVQDKSLEQLEDDLQGIGVELQKIENISGGLSLEQKLSAADGAIKVMAGSLQSVVGALGIIGVESEKFGEFEKKAASVIAFSMGVKDLSEGVGKLAVAYKEAGGAAKIFGKVSKQALLATGIGAFVVALGLIVAYWDDITKAIKGANKELKASNRSIDIQIGRLKESRTILEDTKELRSIEGKELGKINKQLKENLQQELASLEVKLQNLQTILLTQQEQAKDINYWDTIVTYAKNLGNAQAASIDLALQAAGINDDTKETTEKIKNINEQIRDIKKGIAQITSEENKSAKELADNEQKRLDAYLALLNQYITGFEDLQDNTDQKRLDREKKRSKEIIDQMKLTEGEREKLLEAYEAFYEQKQKDLTDIFWTEYRKRRDAEIITEEAAWDEVNQLQIDGLENQKEQADAQLALELERIDAELKAKMESLNAQLLADEDFFDSFQEQRDAADALAIAKRKAANKQHTDLIRDLSNYEKVMAAEVNAYRVDVYAQGAEFLGALTMELLNGSKDAARIAVVLEKSAAIAGIIANTALANAKAVAAFPLTLGQPWVGLNTVSAGLSIASTVLAAGQALSAINNPSSGGGTVTKPSYSGGSAPSPSTSQQGPIPQVDQASACMRTYVLAGDVTSDQEANAKLNRKRTLG